MSVAASAAFRAHEENWLPILELSVQEVFEIMVGCHAKPAPRSAHPIHAEFTAMVGLAGALCGVLAIGCDTQTAHHIAKCLVGGNVESQEQVSDAMGEICNMVAGNFESGVARMKTTSQPAFDRIANLLGRRNYRLRIEGHTDNVPIHTVQFSSNWELSTARATEIVRILIVRDGFAPDRLSGAGYAEYHPIASNRTAQGRGMNRRVDIVILGRALPAIANGSEESPPPAGSHEPDAAFGLVRP